MSNLLLSVSFRVTGVKSTSLFFLLRYVGNLLQSFQFLRAVDNLFEFLVQRNLQSVIVKKEIILFGPRDETQYRLSSKSIPK